MLRPKIRKSNSLLVKATMPFFTVILSKLIMRESQSFTIYMTLVPIILGVGIATITELSFDSIGLFCALLSTMRLSMQNIFSKKVLKDTKIHHFRLMHMLSCLTFLLILPLWLLYDFNEVIQHPSIVRKQF